MDMIIKAYLKAFALAWALVCGAGSGFADEIGDIPFSYDSGTGTMSYFGNSKLENFDVAMYLPGSDFKGMTITGIVVPISSSDISNVSVWISKELKTDVVDGTKVNIPDVLSIEVDNAQLGWNKIVLETPYTVGDEGIYVGYSFEVDSLTEATKHPVLVTTETSDHGFYVRTSRQYRSWVNKSDMCSSCMLAMFSGAYANSVTPELPEEIITSVGKTTAFDITIANYGYKGVKNFDYSLEVAGITTSGHVDFGDLSMLGRYGIERQCEVQMPAISEKGAYTLCLTITKVNGEANSNAKPSATTTYTVYGELATHRTVMEEYTGMWCGNCTRGWVALEHLNEKYPDTFIALAYHSGTVPNYPDPLCVFNDFASDVSGYPAAYIDRATDELDPYHGDNSYSYDMNIEPLVREAIRKVAPADLNIKATLSEDGNTVAMQTSVEFPIVTDVPDYKLEFVLVVDSIQNDKWGQANYISGDTGYSGDEKMKQFIEGGQYIYGLVYNDVVVATSRLNGGYILLETAALDDNGKAEFSYEFDMTSIKNIYDQEFISAKNKENMRVVALLIDSTTGEILNANEAAVDHSLFDGVDIIQIDKVEGPTTFYNLSGQRLIAPQKGLNIIRQADGTAQKVVVK